MSITTSTTTVNTPASNNGISMSLSIESLTAVRTEPKYSLYAEMTFPSHKIKSDITKNQKKNEYPK